jgi:hypothetical protein
MKRSPLHHALLLPFRLMASSEVRQRFDAARLAWTSNDLANFDDELDNQALVTARAAQIERYRSDGDPEQLVFEEVEQGVKVSISPPEEALREIEAMGTANRLLGEATALASWVRATREQRSLSQAIPIADAIERATQLAAALEDTGNSHLGLARRLGGAAIIGTAAVAARHLSEVELATHRAWIDDWLSLGASGASARMSTIMRSCSTTSGTGRLGLGEPCEPRACQRHPRRSGHRPHAAPRERDRSRRA